MRNSFEIIKRTFLEFFRENSLMHGAALAYYSLLALIPILYLAFTYAGSLLGQDTIIEITTNTLGVYIGVQDISGILDFLNNIDLTNESKLLQIVGIVALMFSASAIMNSMKKSINVFYKVNMLKLRKRKMIFRSVLSRLISMTFIVGVAILVMALYFLETVFLTFGDNLFENADFLSWLFSGIVRHGAPILLNLVIFTFIFKYLHDGIVSWAMALRGSALTSVFLYFGQLIIKYYLVNYFFAFESGVGGTLLIVLVWVYYSSQIIFFGAKYIAVRTTYYGGEIKFRD